MPPDYITIPRSEWRALIREVKRGAEVCSEVGDLRIALLALERRLPPAEKITVALVKHVAGVCEDVGRLVIELAALERRLREFDQELTPVRPPSRIDIKQAFENSVDFASGKKKPPST